MNENACINVEWCLAEYGANYSAADIEWARWMWWCDCADCGSPRSGLLLPHAETVA